LSDTFDSKQIIENAHSEISKRKLSGEIPESEISLMNAYSIFKAESGSAQTSLAVLEKKLTKSSLTNIKGNIFFRKIKNIKLLRNFYKRYFLPPINRQNELNEMYFEILQTLSDEIKGIKQEISEL